jgi:methylated-DNA-[protein]-cysteine S-methyltransferase
MTVEQTAPTVTASATVASPVGPLAIVLPCHRVIGSDGSRTGFGGGLERKRALLELESPQLSL